MLLTLAALGNAEWVYHQHESPKMVSFSHVPAATAAQLQRAKLALEKIDGVEEVYVKDHRVWLLKEPKCSWDDIWPAISTAISNVDEPKSASLYRAAR